ncbi:MAG TPA: T9SS type A sorting domain-containing protein [Bacteroidia bacterium]|nr:T9SS type A sorting domain-containing protein [Bacteroidia bacterium]
MKTPCFLIILVLFFSVNAAFSQLSWSRVWDQRYGGNAGDYLMSYKTAPHHGFILAGKTFSDSSGNKTTPHFSPGAADYWIVRVDSLGNKLWEKDFGASGDDQMTFIDRTADGGYILGGSSGSAAGGDKSQNTQGGLDYWIIKTDSGGTIQWEKDFGGTDDDNLYSVQQTFDGGYLLCGDSRSGVGGDKTFGHYGAADFWIVKTDSLGVKQWDKVFGGSAYERFMAMKKTSDGGFLLGGATQSGVSGNKTTTGRGFIDNWIIKIDSAGNKLWEKDFGGSGDDYLTAIGQGADGGYLLGGWSTSGISGDKTQPSRGHDDLWILKTDSLGTKLWDKDFGGTANEDEFTSIYPTPDGGYLLGATSYSNAGGDKTDDNLGVEQPWLIRIDSLGTKLWDKTVFTTGHNEAGFAMEAGDNKCYIVLTADNGVTGGDKTQDAWNNSSDLWIVKYCQGKSTGTEADETALGTLKVFPNPFKNQIHVGWYSDSPLPFRTYVSLYDVYGKKILTQDLNGEITLNTSGLSAGVYILEMKCGAIYRVEKLIK